MPEPLVVDASFTFRLVLPGPEQDRFRSLVDGWLRDGYELFAPTLWVYEMTSALRKLVRFGELTLEEGKHTLKSPFYNGLVTTDWVGATRPNTTPCKGMSGSIHVQPDLQCRMCGYGVGG